MSTLALLLTLLSPQGSAWDQVPGLAKLVTIRADAEPVGALVSRLGDVVGVHLSADPAVAQDRIILTVRDLPAKDLMAKIATHFSWAWRQTKEGPELWQTPEQARAEQEEYWEIALATLRIQRKRAQDALDARKKLDPKTAQLRLEDLMSVNGDLESRRGSEYDKGSPEQQKAWTSAQSKVAGEMGRLIRGLSPAWLITDSVLAGLSDNDLKALTKQDRLVYAYEPTRAQRPLPPAGRTAMDELVALLAPGNTRAVDLDTIKGGILHASGISPQEPFTAQSVRSAYVTLSLSNGPISFRFLEGTSIKIVGRDGQILAQVLPRVPRQAASAPKAPPKKDDAPKDRLDDTLQITETLRAAIQVQPGGQQDPASFEAQRDFLLPGSPTFPARGVARILNEVAGAAQVNLISDCLDHDLRANFGRIPSQTARAAFNYVSQERFGNWKLNGDWVEFRDVMWAASRPRTIPSDRLLKIRDLLLQPFSLERVAQVAGLVTDAQAFGQQLAVLMEERWSFTLRPENLHLLRFWNYLSRNQRSLLLGGQSLVGAKLSKQQATELLRHFANQTENSESASARLDSPLDANDSAWMASHWGRPDWRKDTEVTEILPDGIPDAAVISLRQSTADGIQVTDGRGETRRLRAGDLARSVLYMDPQGKLDMRTTTESRSFFTFDLDGQRFGYFIHGFGPVSEHVYHGVSELPEGLRGRMEATYRATHGGWR